jgi:hypothetical protein
MKIMILIIIKKIANFITIKVKKMVNFIMIMMVIVRFLLRSW